MAHLSADPTFADVLSLTDWQELVARDPDLAARELAQRLRSILSPAQRRACFASITSTEELSAAFRRAAAISRPHAPLAGVPFTLKDLYPIAGQTVRAGSHFPFNLASSPELTGKLPHALEAAGAVLAGRTNLYEFAYGLTGENAHHGDCEHPLFPGRTTGGSSSGAAASVAAGIVPFAVGTDTGGSIRVPAAFCGLFGMRLTPGDEWITDAFPLAPAFDTAGWLTRTAEDMATIIRTILGAMDAGNPNELRGCFIDFAALRHDFPLSRELSRTLRETARKLAPAADAATSEQIGRAFYGSSEAYGILQSTQAFSVHSRWLDKHRSYYSADVWRRIDRGRQWKNSQYEAAAIKQRTLSEFWKQFFKAFDYLVMPATPFTALTKEECTQSNRDHLLALTTPASLAGLPVLTVPVRLASGLSTGLQIIVKDPRSPVIPWVLKKME